MSTEVITFGCRLNAYESEVIRDNAAKAGLGDETVVINSCAVTSEAERQLRQTIRRLRRERPGVRIVVTGCAAQVHPDVYAGMPEVDVVLGNEEKMHGESYARLPFGEEGMEKALVNDIFSIRETAGHLIASMEGKTRAFIQVQNGCDHRCTFCIIPYGRGNSRSVPVGDVVAQVRSLAEQGFQEVVLTGVDISAYGQDLPGQPTLGQMMRRLLFLVPELPRLRVSSIDAVEIDEDFRRVMAEEERLMPHLHISVQAGDDMILKRMKRRHLRDDVIRFCEEMRNLRPDVVFGADLIAGFPTETDEMFMNTLNLVNDAGLTWLHVFPYSERPGTPAARMPQLPGNVRKERAQQLRDAGDLALRDWLASYPREEVEVLVEKPHLGRTVHFAPVVLDKSCEPGSIVAAHIVGYDKQQLQGKVSVC